MEATSEWGGTDGRGWVVQGPHALGLIDRSIVVWMWLAWIGPERVSGETSEREDAIDATVHFHEAHGGVRPRRRA